MRIAAISDIHGNLRALEAVLADIGRGGVDLVVNSGDILSGPLFPAGCATRLIPLGIPTISGNHERQLLIMQENQMGEFDRYTANCLSTDHVSWKAQLPFIAFPSSTHLIPVVLLEPLTF
jgi:predicted phosphodiesterase